MNIPEFSTVALIKMLYKILKMSRQRGDDLELLGGILAVTVKGYRQALGPEQSAMLFYSIADDLATNGLNDDWNEDDAGDQPE